MTQNHTSPVTDVTIEVSILVPARNEEAALERCLRSLVEQQGTRFELIIVDDGSIDRTPQIVETFTGIGGCPFLGTNPFLARVVGIKAREMGPGWVGKSNALWQAAQVALGEWVLFTDADTMHEPGSLSRALAEAKQHSAVMLSYSPKQELGSPAERALMPLIFAELATRFRPSEVRDSGSSVAAANGQYILVRRDVYFAIGGHKATAGELLEDVALAKRVKKAGGKIQFRFGGEQVRTRMYRTWQQMVEGWTKNLVLLFPDARILALKRLSEFTLIVLSALLVSISAVAGSVPLASAGLVIWAVVVANFGVRVVRSHAGILNEAISLLGLPVFSWLLLRSSVAHANGSVTWKGRVYSGSESGSGTGASQRSDQSARDALKIQPVTAHSSQQENDGLPHQEV